MLWWTEVWKCRTSHFHTGFVSEVQWEASLVFPIEPVFFSFKSVKTPPHIPTSDIYDTQRGTSVFQSTQVFLSVGEIPCSSGRHSSSNPWWIHPVGCSSPANQCTTCQCWVGDNDVVFMFIGHIFIQRIFFPNGGKSVSITDWFCFCKFLWN